MDLWAFAFRGQCDGGADMDILNIIYQGDQGRRVSLQKNT